MGHRSLSVKFVLLYLAAGLLPLLMLMLLFAEQITRQSASDAMDLYALEIRQVGNRIESYMRRVAENGTQIASDPQLISYLNPVRVYQTPMASINAYNSYLKPLIYNQFLMGNRHDQLKIYFLNETMMQGYGIYLYADDTVRGQETFARAVAADGRPTWWYARDPGAVRFVQAISDINSRLYGVVEITLASGDLQALLDGAAPDRFVLSLLDGEGTVVAGNRHGSAGEAGSAIDPDAQRGEVRSGPPAGDTAHLSYRLAGGAHVPAWTLTMDIPMAALNRRNRDQRADAMLVGTLLAVSAATFFFVMLQRELRRLRPLLGAMRAARAGKLEQVRGAPPHRDEIGEMIVSYNHMARDLERLIQDNYVAKLAQREAELNALQSQLNPHFLHNMLEHLRMRMVVGGDPEAATMVLLLSRMLRKSIQWTGAQVTLAEELSFVENYLQLQQIRYGGRLRYAIEAPDAVRLARVPKFSIQPLVENAIKHGVSAISKGGTVAVRAEIRGGNLAVSVSDDSCRNTRDACARVARALTDGPADDHVGIGNVHQRVRLQYGDPYGVVDISPADLERGTGWIVRLLMPFEVEDA